LYQGDTEIFIVRSYLNEECMVHGSMQLLRCRLTYVLKIYYQPYIVSL